MAQQQNGNRKDALKDYVDVNKRIESFWIKYPEGRIDTEIVKWEDAVIVMKVCVYTHRDNEKPSATGHAYEKEGSSFINKTSALENCVPLDTQILTKEGWKFYYQLREGEEVLSHNMETGKNEFCKLLRVNFYEKKPLVKLKTSRFEAICTPEHKWITDTQYAGVRKTATKDLNSSSRIIQNEKQESQSSVIGRKLGWLMCDCEIDYTKNGLPSTAYINQSKHIEDVKELFGEGRLLKKYDEKWLDSYEWIIPAEQVRGILGYFNMVSYKDLPLAMAKAELSDVAGCYESVMKADGDDRGFSSTYKELVEAVQVMCVRLGIPTSFITSRMMKNSTKPLYTLGIKKSNRTYASELEITNLPPRDVWCPTTENGTWFMKQGTFVSLTSNCETSAVGRALAILGFEIKKSIASRQEVQNATTQKPKELIKVDEKQLEELENKILDFANIQKIDRTAILSALKVKTLEGINSLQFEGFMAQLDAWINKAKQIQAQGDKK